MFKFLLVFFIDITTPVISSTQIARDVMCEQHAIHQFFSITSFFRRPFSHLNQTCI